MNEYNSLERKAALVMIQGTQLQAVHVAMFMEILAAKQAGNEKLASFYADRFPPDVRKAYDAWMAQKPLENPKADEHPFVPRLYEPRGTREAAVLNAQAEQCVQNARKAGAASGQYLGNTVLFATMLFFASTSSKFEEVHLRWSTFMFAVLIFAYALGRMIMLPR
jgi:hypothetical protein